jgi:hypothetical protein
MRTIAPEYGQLGWTPELYTTCEFSVLPIQRNDSGVRLAELKAALSIATDLGTVQPVEFTLRAGRGLGDLIC